MKNTDGTLLALAAVATLAAAGTVRSRRGSGAQIEDLTAEQLDLIMRLAPTWAPHPAAPLQRRLKAGGVDPDQFFWQDAVAERQRRQRAWLRNRYGADLSGGAEWGGEGAWMLDQHDPREGYSGQRYLLLDDTAWLVVQRWADDSQTGNADIDEIIQFGEDFGAAKRWLEQHA